MDSKTISIISLLISILGAIYNYLCNHFNVKAKIQNFTYIDDSNQKYLLLDVDIDNRSRHFISINKIALKYNKNTYQALTKSIHLGKTEGTVFNQKYLLEKNSTELPLKLSSYDSFTATFIFPIDKIENIKLAKITIYSSRGKKRKILIMNY